MVSFNINIYEFLLSCQAFQHNHIRIEILKWVSKSKISSQCAYQDEKQKKAETLDISRIPAFRL